MHINLVTVLKLLFLKVSMTFWQWMRASCQCWYSFTYLQHDTIDHDMLLHHLQHVFSIQGTVLSLFRSYRTKRFQIVSTQSTHSDQIEFCYDVPQGSVIRHILFVLNTQPLTSVILKHPVSHMYADDTQVYKSLNCE